MCREFSTPSPPQLSICESSPFFSLCSCFFASLLLCFFASFLLCFFASLPPLPSYPFSFHTLAHSLPRNTRGGGTDSLRQRLQCFYLRLFGSFPRIPVRMSATISCLTSQWSSLLGTPAMPGPTLFFSTLMGNEAKTTARGLQKRDPDMLDHLIEQYQYRLFRYLVYVTGNKERAEDFFQETWIRVLERGHQYDGKSKFQAWLFAIAR